MKLFHKGLIFLVSVLASQTLVFGILSYTLWKTQADMRKSEYVRTMMTAALTIDANLFDASSQLMLYCMNQSAEAEHKFMEATAQPALEFEKLHQQIRLNSDVVSARDKEDLTKLETDVIMFLKILNDAKQLVRTNGPAYQFLELKDRVQYELNPLFAEIRAEANGIRHRFRGMKQITPAEEERARRVVELSLLGLFVVNGLATTVLVVGFNRGITRRLALIEGSVKAIAEGKGTLHKASSGGTDEIATLDKAFQDMTAALQEASAKDKAVFENLPVGLVECDAEGTIETLNPKARQLLLLNEDSAPLGVKFDDIVRNKDASLTFEQLLQQTRNKVQRARIKKGTGELLSADMAAAGYQHKGSERYLFSFIDVTQQEYAEQLRQEFISVVSHDLRTPLTSMKAFLTVLETGTYGTLTETGQNRLKRVQSEGVRLLRLTADLLDLARLESGNVVLTPDNHPVSSIIERSLDAVAALAEEKSIELCAKTVDLDFTADGDRIVQVLVNFLSNAIKFSNAGDRVSLEAALQENMIKFSVIDQGRGIDPEVQEVIFERFKQSRVDDAKSGTGLGLAICKLLADALGGEVGVNSAPGKGSTFWLTVPVQTHLTKQELKAQTV